MSDSEKDLERKPPLPADLSLSAAVSRLRLLDFDDLFLLSHLLSGHTIAATARHLGLTQPAITQRVRKIERVFHENLLEKVGRHVRLTPVGRAICLKASDALGLMRAVTVSPADQAVTLGLCSVTGAYWLWPVLAAIRAARPNQLVHCLDLGREEAAARLESGGVDAVLLPAAEYRGVFPTVSAGEEELIAVAHPELSPRCQADGELSRILLLEVDRSMPLFGHFSVAARANLQFRDIWFLGSVARVMAAALAGAGVAVLPLEMIRAELAAGRLVQVLSSLECLPVRYCLAYRPEAGLEPVILELSTRLAAASAT